MTQGRARFAYKCVYFLSDSNKRTTPKADFELLFIYGNRCKNKSPQ